MDMQRHEAAVEVITPEELRAEVAAGCGGRWGNMAADRMDLCGCRMF